MADQTERRPVPPAQRTTTPPPGAAAQSARASNDAPAQIGKHRCVLLHPTGEGDSLPSELLQSLAKRIGRLTFCTDAYSAMAEVCRHELDRREHSNAQPTGAGEKADSAGSLVLMLISPARLADAVELVESLKLYAPATVCWWYDRAFNPRPRAVTDADIASWSATNPAAAAPATPPTANTPCPPVVTTRVPPIHTLRTPSSPPRPPQTPAPRAAHSSSGPTLRLAGTQPTNPRPADQQPPKRPVDSPLIPLDEEPERDPRLPPLLTEEELQVLLSDDPTPPQRPNGVPPPGSPR